MPKFVIGTPVDSDNPVVEVTVDPAAPLAAGRHRFQLVVVDDSRNESAPDTLDVIVRDTTKPTAVLSAPSQVEFGQSFSLDGRRSSDVPPGRVARYIFTLLE
jgi:hypothetical protein